MLSEDYIFRQISQVTAVIARVLGLSKAGNFKEAQGEIDQAVEGLVGLNVNIVRQLDDAGIVSLLTSFQQVDFGKLFALASLFEVEGDVLAAQNRSGESRSSYERALGLYQEIAFSGSESLETDVAAKIAGLREKLA